MLYNSLIDAYLQQNNLIKARDDKYLSRIKVLEELVVGTHEENKVLFGYFLYSWYLLLDYDIWQISCDVTFADSHAPAHAHKGRVFFANCFSQVVIE